MNSSSETTNTTVPLPLIQLDEEDIMEIVETQGGCCASDPLFAFMLACSPDARPGLADNYRYAVEKNLQRSDYSRQKLLRDGGMKRLGSVEEQEEMERRLARKRTSADCWQEKKDEEA